MKKSLLALAISLAAASGAHAAWDNGSVNGTGNGELLLAVWDSNTGHQTSVAVDLGVKYSTLASNISNSAYSLSFNLDPTAFTTAFGTSNLSDLRYSLIALNNNTFDVPTVLVTSNVANPAANFNDVQNMTAASVATASYVNTDTNMAANLSTVGTTANGRYLGVASTYGDRFTATSSPFNIADSVNKSLAFYQFNSSDASGLADVKAAGVWSINLSNLSSATLTYGSSAPAVPVPAAIWLMGSALAGLGSIARRRRAA